MAKKELKYSLSSEGGLWRAPSYTVVRWSKKYGHKILLILCYGNEKETTQFKTAV